MYTPTHLLDLQFEQEDWMNSASASKSWAWKSDSMLTSKTDTLRSLNRNWQHSVVKFRVWSAAWFLFMQPLFWKSTLHAFIICTCKNKSMWLMSYAKDKPCCLKNMLVQCRVRRIRKCSLHKTGQSPGNDDDVSIILPFFTRIEYFVGWLGRSENEAWVLYSLEKGFILQYTLKIWFYSATLNFMEYSMTAALQICFRHQEQHYICACIKFW